MSRLGSGYRAQRCGFRQARPPQAGIWLESQYPPLISYSVESDFLGDFEPIVQVMAETAIVLRRMQFASGHARYSQAHTGVVRAFPALMLGQNLGKMMVREAREA